MNRRPKFWIHRSSRFWSGLLVMLLLFGAWIHSMQRGISVIYWTEGKDAINLTAGITQGGLQAEYAFWANAGSGATTRTRHWLAHGSPAGARLIPRLEWKKRMQSGLPLRYFQLFIPLWIPLLAWIGYWLWWMRRGDVKEDKLYGDPQSASILSPEDKTIE